ncbi:hypothetical protein [Longimicrobium terrae]|uniref:Lipoprotein n=1 Tax=Longimicrobium terrae TaxID=1639882 RepID=A0A841GTQ7_9BACT|nr:hypothetical protein [Longimicrobium terrae]MBB4635615.1 hypothetical protein [Longimicrobium terrae]MBB6070009.1 hypothetical protein [Longimicrobium terrae]NNC32919.1 hypothetical protein [Longimicrobium terrae]
MRSPKHALAVIGILSASGCDSLPTRSDSTASVETELPVFANAGESSICTNRAVPSGYVVISATLSPSCPGYSSYGSVAGQINSVTVRKPTSGLTICAGWPTPGGDVDQFPPLGYVVVASTSTAACPDRNSYARANGYTNALTIQTLASPITICGAWPIARGIAEPQRAIPVGYVVVSMSHSKSCYNYRSGGGDFNALTLRTPSSPMTICAGWPIVLGYAEQRIPSGYVVTGIATTVACPNYYPGGGKANALEIRTLTSPITICGTWPIPTGVAEPQRAIPEGYVVVSTSSIKSCYNYRPGSGDFNALTLRTPSSPMTICSGWPIVLGYAEQRIPPGYVVTGMTTTVACPNYYPGGGNPNAFVIRTPTSPMTICKGWPFLLGYAYQAIPSGYVLASRTNSTACPGYDPFHGELNAMNIRRK